MNALSPWIRQSLFPKVIMEYLTLLRQSLKWPLNILKLSLCIFPYGDLKDKISKQFDS